MLDQYTRAVRIWKRDGTINRMTLRAAVHNLIRWHRNEKLGIEDDRDRLRQKLLAGETLETPCAYLRAEFAIHAEARSA